MANPIDDKVAQLTQSFKRLRNNSRIEFGAMVLPGLVVLTMLLLVGMLTSHLTSYVSDFCAAKDGQCKIVAKAKDGENANLRPTDPPKSGPDKSLTVP